MATGHSTPYQKVHFKPDGGFETETLREGKKRADTYYSRAKSLVKKAEELHTSTGADVKLLILPSWHKGKPKTFVSPNFPVLEEVTVEVLPEAVATAENIAVPTPTPAPPSPRVMREIPVNQNSCSTVLPNHNDKNQCSICHIIYNTEADFESHWVQCSKKGCSWWVHCRCIGIYYPPTTAGHKALTKWAKNRVFCPRHIM